MQTNIDEDWEKGDDGGKESKSLSSPLFSIGEAVRNANYHSRIEPSLADRQQEIFEIILMHPEGISAKGISEKHFNGRPIHTFSGRLSELANPKGYVKRPYCNPPLIESFDVERYPDFDGRMRLYTKYRIRRATL